MGSKYYDSIDNLPIGIFNKILSTGNLSLLVIDGNVGETRLKDIWIKIYNEYIAHAGVPDTIRDYIRLKLKANTLWYDVLVNGKAWKHSLAAVADHEAEQVNKLDVKGSFSSNVAYMSQWYGFRIDTSSLTVLEFLGYLDNMQNGK